jgi:hypothetical protein
MSGDGQMLDGLFSGLLPPMPEGAEIQFYLETMDISEVLTTSPGNPAFAPRGQPVTLHSLAVGVPRPPLEISEIVADNRTGLRDEGNGTPDWIEVRNCSGAPVSLAGVSLGQKFFGSGQRIFFTNITLLPGEHFVVYADNNTDQGPLHAPFEMNDDGDTAVLTGIAPNGARMLIDSASFGEQPSDVAWARLGCGGPWRKSAPTPFAGNIESGWAAVTDANTITFGYATLPGFTYTVESSDSLAPGSWDALPAVSGTGVEQTVVQPLTSRRFFRVRRQ